MSPPRCDNGRGCRTALGRGGYWEAGETSLPRTAVEITLLNVNEVSLNVNEVSRCASAPFVRPWFLALQPADWSYGAVPAAVVSA